MNTEEFSTEFDVQVSSYYPGGVLFDEYEKSVFLTDMQDLFALQMYANFEKKEIAREALAPLVKTYISTEEYNGYEDNECDDPVLKPISDMSYFHKLPDDLWLIIYEEVVVSDSSKCINGKHITVSPTTHDKVSKIIENPFKRPSDNRALRLNITDNVVELISKYNVDKYYLRYIKKPNPIILTNLTDSVSIKGKTDRTECELPETVHRDILNMAVQAALQSKMLLRGQQQQPQQQEQSET